MTQAQKSAPTAQASALRVVVIGQGMAGGRLVDEILERQADGRTRRPVALTVVGGEPYGAYNRVLLSEVLSGRADVAALSLSDPTAYQARGVDVRLGVHAISITLPPRQAGDGDAAAAEGAEGEVRLDDGSVVPFDRLVLATGADPIVPPLGGLDPDRLPAGVHTFRTIDDCREIVAGTANATRAIVLGGGVLGLETARGLARRGLEVIVLHGGPHLLERQLDAAGGQVLDRGLRRLGVRTRTAISATAITSLAGRLTGVVIDGGRSAGGADGRPAGGVADTAGGSAGGPEHLATDLLVISCGVRPRTGLAERAGLGVHRGVLVDDGLRTTHPAVLAIGDCAEHDGQLPGLIAPAWQQARVVADQLTGADPLARYRPAPPAVRLKAADIEVAAAGEAQIDPWCDEPGLDVVQLLDPGQGRYVKAVIRRGVVVGAMAVGDPRAAAELSLLVERGTAAPRDRTALLLPGRRAAAAPSDDPTLIPDRATVCRCNGVTKGAIVRAWTTGARTPEAIAARTKASTGCGSCADAVSGLLDWLAASDPDDPRTAPSPAPARVDEPITSGGPR